MRAPTAKKFFSSRALGGCAILAAVCLATSIDARAYSPHAYAGPVAPYAGPINHAHAAPAFQWGWFGADHYQQRAKYHRDYNGDLMRWGKYRRY